MDKVIDKEVKSNEITQWKAGITERRKREERDVRRQNRKWSALQDDTPHMFLTREDL